MLESVRLRSIQQGVLNCDRCLRDSKIAPHLRSLPFFLPLPSNVEEPTYTYFLAAKEPSGNLLRTEAEGRRMVSEGYVNFATTLNDYMRKTGVSRSVKPMLERLMTGWVNM